MLFADMQDSHDKRTETIVAKMDHASDASILTNFNLVGIRRRLNNIEVGVWFVVVLVALNTWRHW